MWQRCMGCKSWKALAERVHSMKMHVRHTPPFLKLQFGYKINATGVWFQRKFCNDRSSDFPFFAREAARLRLYDILSPLAPASFSSSRCQTV